MPPKKPLTKAYDFAALVERIKNRELDITEEALKIILEEGAGWFEESAVLSATPYDNMALFVLPEVKKLALEQIDKIDGKVG
jgi:hypothetical protein